MNYTYLESPIGDLLIAGEDGALCEIRFAKAGPADPEPTWNQSEVGLESALNQLRDYFARLRRCFALDLKPQGTPFQQKVWQQLRLIPYGETISYGELACRIGNPSASRAVGAANTKNPIPIVIPCHRVIGSNGKLTGFGGGLPTKAQLLQLEGIQSPTLPFENRSSQ
jgi:methylated-DNA-[protein]-cysteine S-methyltransferase